MKFKTFIPAAALAPFIRMLVIQETDDESVYKVLPDTGLVIGFQYKGRLANISEGKEDLLAISGISGLADQYKIFKNSEHIGSVLVFFKEGGAANFFKQPIHELFRESVSLDNFLLRSELLVLEERLYEAMTDTERIAIVEHFLIQQIKETKQDPLVLAALSLIHKSKGNIRIKELCEQLHTSQSPLEKKFRAIVGATPKKFSSIVRLKNVLKERPAAVSLTALAYDTGFYDQAHFIKEFKTFTGETLEEFFQEK